ATAGVCRFQDINQERRLVEQCDGCTARRKRRRGTLLDLVQNWGFFGDQLREKLTNHAVRQITLNSACEQLPVKEYSVSKSTNLDELNLERPLIQYRIDSDYNYVRKSFKKLVEVHQAIFDAMGITRRKLQADDDTKPLN